jgi:bacterioferritin
VLKGAQWMTIASELKLHAVQELQHRYNLHNQIDYLG